MKNKESFLKELQDRLSVLEESEQQDILAEYAQHIDLRVAGGLTEEAAIRDFGDIDQLTVEILSAYHVKPTYQAPKGKRRIPNPWPAIRRGTAKAGSFFRRLGGGIAGGFGKLWGTLKAWKARLEERLGLNRDFFEAAETEVERDAPETAESGAAAVCAAEEIPPCPGEETENKEAVEPVNEKKETARTAAGSFFRRLGHGLWRLCRGAAWLAWNLFLLLCALPFAGLGLLALMCLGTLVVLLIQGYPLAGVTLCCLGGAACCVGILGLGSGLIWHRARPAAQATGTVFEAEPVTALVRETVMEAERDEVTEDDAE